MSWDEWQEDEGDTTDESSKAAGTPASPEEITEVDQAFSVLIQQFVDTMRVEPGSEIQRQHAVRFNETLDAFLSEHPEASLTDIAEGLSQLGVPYEQALSDLVYVRGLGDE